MRETLEAFAYPLEQQGFKLEVDVAADLPEVPMDADAIGQALLNLIDNAIKYSGRARSIARRRARATASGSRCSVADRGHRASRPASTRGSSRSSTGSGRSETRGGAAAASGWRWCATSPRPTAAA